MTVKKSTLVCVVQAPDDPLPDGIRFSSDIDELKEWSTKSAEQRRKDRTAASKDQADRSVDENFPLLMNRIVSSVHQQSEMLNILQTVRDMFPMITIKREFIDVVLSSKTPVHKDGNAEIFKLDNSDLIPTSDIFDKVDHVRSGMAYLPTGLLLSIVATFDGHMSDIIRVMLRVKSDRLRAGERKVSLCEILDAKNLEEVINAAILEEIYSFSRNSHDEQVKYIEDSFSISIRKYWKRWPDFIEVFERRNLVAHGEAKFTSRYASICGKHGHKGCEEAAGKDVKITFNYLRQSLEILVEFSLLAIFSLWRKHVPGEEEEAFARLNEIVYDLIFNQQPIVAVRVAEYGLSIKSDQFKEATRLRLVVNLASAQRHAKLDEAALKTLDKVDWSAASDDYKICVAALRNDVDMVIALLPIVRATKSIEAESFRQWPLFKFIKDNERFQEAFNKEFGEPYGKFSTPAPDDALQSEGVKSSSAVTINHKSEDGTMH